MAVNPDALVALGVIARPHGVRGEVRVHLFNPASTLLLECDHVVLRMPDGEWVAEVVRSRPDKDGVLMHFAETTDRDAADELRGAEVCIPRAALPPIEDGEFYHVDAIGLRVVNAAGDDLGEVTEVVRYPSADCFRVRSADGLREVPNVDAYIVAVDLAAGQLRVHDLSDLDVQKPKPPKA